MPLTAHGQIAVPTGRSFGQRGKLVLILLSNYGVPVSMGNLPVFGVSSSMTLLTQCYQDGGQQGDCSERQQGQEKGQDEFEPAVEGDGGGGDDGHQGAVG